MKPFTEAAIIDAINAKRKIHRRQAAIMIACAIIVAGCLIAVRARAADDRASGCRSCDGYHGLADNGRNSGSYVNGSVWSWQYWSGPRTSINPYSPYAGDIGARDSGGWTQQHTSQQATNGMYGGHI